MNTFTFLPYPSPKNAHRDTELARQAYPLLAHTLNSFSDYLYYSIKLGDIMHGVSALFESIATIKLKHLKLISEMIHYLGGDPAINTRTRNLPSGISENDSGAAFDEVPLILQALIAGEDEAAAQYSYLAEYAGDNPAAASILSRLAADSADNARLLRQVVVR